MIKTKLGKHVISAFLLLVFGILSIGSEERDPNAWKTEDNKIMAYIMMNEFIKERLIAPITAEFPSYNYDNIKVKTLENHTYAIFSYVDSQNAFGAMLRTTFIGEIKQVSEDGWQLISLDIN